MTPIAIQPTVAAIVLTGGRARRLDGTDKARLRVGERPMVESVIAAATAVSEQVVTVGPAGDVREDPPFSGPVMAIAAGLRSLPEAVDVVVVLACDLPDLDAATLRALLDALSSSPSSSPTASAALAVDAGGRDQYLLAAWDRCALAARISASEPGPRSSEGGDGLVGRSVRSLYDDDEVLIRVPVGNPARDIDTWADLAGRGPITPAHVGAVLRAGLLRDGVPRAKRRFRAPLDALDGVLTDPLVAADPMPRGRVSAMDGYALAGPGPWRLTDTPRRAGDGAPAQLRSGTSAVVATGALAPGGTDRVLRHELVELAGDAEIGYDVTALPEACETNDLRPVGEDWAAGFELAPAGTTLDAALASAALSAGVDGVTVRGPIHAVVVTTGDEVLPATTTAPLPPGRIRDTVGPLLGGILARAGFATPKQGPGSTIQHCPDTPEAFDALLSSGDDGGAGDGNEDVLVLVGATGRGVADHLRAALERVGARIVLDGVRVRPGGSQLVALLPDGRVLLGLPGNPLAAVCAAATTGRALVDALTGRQRTPVLTMIDSLGDIAAPGRARILPARPDGGGGWTLTDRVRTAHLADLASAPSLAVVPEAATDATLVELVDWI